MLLSVVFSTHCTFCFAVGLRVVSGGEVRLHAQESAEIREEGVVEARPAVGKDVERQTEAADDLVHQCASGRAGSSGLRRDGHEVVGEVIDDDQDMLEALALGEGSREVEANHLPGF